MTAPIVIKISGHELDDAEYLAQFATVIRTFDSPVVIVHGGGKEISALQAEMGIDPKYVDGIRITDAASLQLVEMVLCGTVNKRLTRTLVNNGVDALGMSGVDMGLVRAEKMQVPGQDMGFTGVAVGVRGDVLLDLLARHITPVIAPICIGENHNYNVNADHVAGAIGGTLDAAQLVFLSNVPGVLLDGAVLPHLTPAKTEAMIASGAIFGGMIPKVRTALHALEDGVKQAVITDLDGLMARGGTVFTP
ncbi:MAG: acetylglutamate kinase [Anaerolineae bacterium]|nr:acetylglutamate kinase [Anaerolineae bacterium]